MGQDIPAKYYFDHPQIWEKLRSPLLSREISFLREIFSRRTSVTTALDIGCGTGQHSRHLARHGIDVTGIDINPRMIEFAQSRFPQGKFHVADMSRLPPRLLKPVFDAAICLNSTFSYNLTHDDIRSCLRGLHQSLKHHGLLIIEVFNPIAFLQGKRLRNSFFLENPRPYTRLGLKVEVRHQVMEAEQIIEETRKTYRVKPRPQLLKTDRTKMRMFFPQELKFILESSGFRVLDQYGRHKVKYRRLDRTRFITVAEKSMTEKRRKYPTSVEQEQPGSRLMTRRTWEFLKEEAARIDQELTGMRGEGGHQRAEIHDDMGTVNRRNQLDARRQRFGDLERVELIEPRQETDQVGIGNKVVLKYQDDDEELALNIVGPDDIKLGGLPSGEFTSPDSPIGKAVMGRKKGDTVEVRPSPASPPIRVRVADILKGEW